MASENATPSQDGAGHEPQATPMPAAPGAFPETPQPLSSSSIELSHLQASAAGGESSQQGQEVPVEEVAKAEATTTQTEQKTSEIAPVATKPDTQQSKSEINPSDPVTPPPLVRAETSAIGPATDEPTPTKGGTTEGPFLYITLLNASTGARHPFKLDSRYLKKRGVEVEENNPINLSLYKLKELILRDWREEWTDKPNSPESIRLITMGKLLNDKARLVDSGFTNGITPHIVHMTVKPQDIIDEEEANKAAGKDRDGNERSPGCRCVIQ